MPPRTHSYADLQSRLADRLDEVERALAAWGARGDDAHIAQCGEALRRARLLLAMCDAPPSALLESLDALHRVHSALLVHAAGVAYRLTPSRGTPATKPMDARRTWRPSAPVVVDVPHGQDAIVEEPDWEILPSL